jgi:hypothetical protein
VDDHALILYVYLSNYDDGADESVLTVRLARKQDFDYANHITVLHQLIYGLTEAKHS